MEGLKKEERKERKKERNNICNGILCVLYLRRFEQISAIFGVHFFRDTRGKSILPLLSQIL